MTVRSLLVGLCLTSALSAGAADTPPGTGTVAIAPLAEAITFARIRSADDAYRTIAVTDYAAATVRGVDLAGLLGRPVPDPITVLRAEGWTALRDRIAAAPDATRVSVPAALLGLPVDLGARHIAAGTNTYVR
jgi:hypothetical protein